MWYYLQYVHFNPLGLWILQVVLNSTSQLFKEGKCSIGIEKAKFPAKNKKKKKKISTWRWKSDHSQPRFNLITDHS